MLTNRSLMLALLVVFSSLLSAATAQTLPPSSGIVHASALDLSQTQFIGAGGQLHLDRTLNDPDFTRQALARAESFGGVAPEAVADAETQVVKNNPPSGDLADALAQATASLNYHVRLSARSSPLVFNPPVTFNVAFHGDASVTGGGDGNGDATASFTASFGAGASISDSVGLANTTHNVSDTQTFQYTIDSSLLPIDYLVTVSASASATGFNLGGTASAQAACDPVFTFDQARFDELAAANGFATFPLDQYFGFDFSPDIVPEPPAAVLALLAAAVLLGAGRVRRRSASPPCSCRGRGTSCGLRQSGC